LAASPAKPWRLAFLTLAARLLLLQFDSAAVEQS
jgi:hypothetical protein